MLLPRREVPDGAELGTPLEVFVHQDSDDRPIATLTRPKLELGEVAFLEVTDRAAFGAFCDWGLAKELLVPLAEQTCDLAVGDRHPIGLYVDDSGRLAGTMRVSELLRRPSQLHPGDWAIGEAWRRDPDIGVFVILERPHVGLLPASEPHRPERGGRARFRVTARHPDGKLEVSLRDLAHRELARDGDAILRALAARPTLEVGDRSSPEQVFAAFGLSKKAFKRAVGGLLRHGRVALDAHGNVVAKR